MLNKWLKILIVLLILIILGVSGYYVYIYYFKPKDSTSETKTSEKLSLDSIKEATYLSKVANTENAYWQRMFEIFWNDVENEKGDFNWQITDNQIKLLNKENVYPVATIKPFANWDQDSCHPESSYEAESHGPASGTKIKVGAPCDINAYNQFLAKLVERYDGDDQDDMPGLTIPIKYWEIMNEPSMQGGSTGGVGEELKFFVGTSKEYFEILKNSYQTIKQADLEAKVLHAGMAGMQQNFQDFWDPVFDAGAGNYFDIANIHTINTNDKREDLYLIKFKKYLEKYGLKDKPIWVTELQYGELTDKPTDTKDLEILMAKSTIFSLALGADKLFYIDNWLWWEEGGFTADDKKEEIKENIDKEESIGKKAELHQPNLTALKSSTHKVYLNLVDKVNKFDKIVIIKQEYQENPKDNDGVTSNIGQYKFISNSDVLYVLWGKGEMPSEISGKIKVTDIYGESKEMTSDDLILTNEPIFIEIL